MLALDIKWKGFRGARGKFAAGTKELQKGQRRVVRNTAKLYAQHARRLAPRGKYFDLEGNPTEPDHERLHKSIRVGRSKTLATKAGSIGGTQISVEMASHGQFTLRPTKPHDIPQPRGSKALSFFWFGGPPSAQRWATGPIMGHGFAVYLPQGVSHPGYTPPEVNWSGVAWWSYTEPVMWNDLKRIGQEWRSSITLAGA